MFVVDSYLSDERISYLRQTGQGVSQARNQGIAAGTNPYIAFLDGDDYWYDEHLTEFVQASEAEPEGVIYWTAADCYIELTFPKTGEKHTTHRIANHILNYDSFDSAEKLNSIRLSPLMTSQVVIWREECEKLDFIFDTELCLGEDQDLWLRLLALRNNGIQIPAVTGNHRAHEDQTTQGGSQLGGTDTDRLERLQESRERFMARHGYMWSGEGIVRDDSNIL
jgi:glycosyltransferase involved in cell wall biosynthesis